MFVSLHDSDHNGIFRISPASCDIFCLLLYTAQSPTRSVICSGGEIKGRTLIQLSCLSPPPPPQKKKMGELNNYVFNADCMQPGSYKSSFSSIHFKVGGLISWPHSGCRESLFYTHAGCSRDTSKRDHKLLSVVKLLATYYNAKRFSCRQCELRKCGIHQPYVCFIGCIMIGFFASCRPLAIFVQHDRVSFWSNYYPEE